MKNIKDLFVTYKIALKLKELGFNLPVHQHYYKKKLDINTFLVREMDAAMFPDDGKNGVELNSYHERLYLDCNQYDKEFVSAPTCYQVIDWFREKKIHISLPNHYDGYCIDIRNFNNDSSFYSLPNKWYEKYEEACEEAILNAIELCQQ